MILVQLFNISIKISDTLLIPFDQFLVLNVAILLRWPSNVFQLGFKASSSSINCCFNVVSAVFTIRSTPLTLIKWPVQFTTDAL